MKNSIFILLCLFQVNSKKYLLLQTKLTPKNLHCCPTLNSYFKTDLATKLWEMIHLQK